MLDALQASAYKQVSAEDNGSQTLGHEGLLKHRSLDTTLGFLIRRSEVGPENLHFEQVPR